MRFYAILQSALSKKEKCAELGGKKGSCSTGRISPSPHPIGHAVYVWAFHTATKPWVAPSTRQNATFSTLNMLSRLACLPPKWGGCSNALQLWHFYFFSPRNHSVIAPISGNRKLPFFLIAWNENQFNLGVSLSVKSWNDNAHKMIYAPICNTNI